jgi:hypothetical protein
LGDKPGTRLRPARIRPENEGQAAVSGGTRTVEEPSLRPEEKRPDDAELMDRVRIGDVEAFGELYRRHTGAALRYARTWSRDAATAEDLCAEAFSQTLCALLNGRGPDGPLAPYLKTVFNAAVDIRSCQAVRTSMGVL